MHGATIKMSDKIYNDSRVSVGSQRDSGKKLHPVFRLLINIAEFRQERHSVTAG
jgi:hypothetical protein